MEPTQTPGNQSMPIRSPLLMSTNNTALIVIDVQQKLAPAIADSARAIWNIGRLIEAAKLLDVPIFATEQYPQGLGTTVPELSAQLEHVVEKRFFSCRECVTLIDQFRSAGFENILLTGIESHVCVQQSAIDLQSAGFNIFIPIDAIGSRNRIDHDIAISRMQMSGVTVTTTESAIFEMCETSTHPNFKLISKLVQQSFEDIPNAQV